MVVESEPDGVGRQDVGGRIELDLELADVVDSWGFVDYSWIVEGELVGNDVIVHLVIVELVVGEEVHDRWVGGDRIVGLDGDLRSEVSP